MININLPNLKSIANKKHCTLFTKSSISKLLLSLFGAAFTMVKTKLSKGREAESVEAGLERRQRTFGDSSALSLCFGSQWHSFPCGRLGENEIKVASVLDSNLRILVSRSIFTYYRKCRLHRSLM